MDCKVVWTEPAIDDLREIVIQMESGAQLRFPVARNPRLATGTPKQLAHIKLSPFGIHWPELDEDLSFRGIADGDYGQCRTSASC